MTAPFLGQIHLFSFNFAPQGWAMCNGQLLPINQNQALFALLGTTYGGNGQTNFALPDLRGKIPMHFQNNAFTLGQTGGQAAHTVTISELPTHTHVFTTTNAVADSVLPAGNTYATIDGANGYAAPTNLAAIQPATIANTGGSQPHNNMSPFLVLTFCIALQGFFPSPS